MKMNYMFRSKDQRCQTSKLRRFSHYVGTLNWKLCPSVYLRVSYGRQEDAQGKAITMYNDGIYTNKEEFMMALKAFTEK